MKELALAELLNALDIVVLELHEDLSYIVVGEIPVWFQALYPEALQISGFHPGRQSNYRTDFFQEAGKFWAAKGAGPAPAGQWLETDDSGTAVELRAMAVMAGKQRLVLLEKISEASPEKQALIQRALGLQRDYRQLHKMKNTLEEAYADIEQQVAPRMHRLKQSYQRLNQETAVGQKSAEAFRKIEFLLHSIFDSIRDGMIIIDPNFSILRANLAMAKNWGTTARLEKHQCFAAWQGRQVPCSWCTASLTLEKGKVLWQEISSPPEGESSGRLKLVTFPLRNDAGQVIGVIEYFHAITEHRPTEGKEARRAKKSKALRTLPQGLSHDFNNILNSVLGYTEMALLSLSDPRQVGETEFFLKEAFQAEELAEELLAQF